jgi:hypothetical protein
MKSHQLLKPREYKKTKNGVECFLFTELVGLKQVECFLFTELVGLKQVECFLFTELVGLKQVECFLFTELVGLKQVECFLFTELVEVNKKQRKRCSNPELHRFSLSACTGRCKNETNLYPQLCFVKSFRRKIEKKILKVG